MDIYHEIKIVNDFQEKFGLRQSVRRACDLLVSYIGGLQKPLTEIAAQGFNVLTLQSNARKVLLFPTKWRLRECR
jgi:hypothetical protein